MRKKWNFKNLSKKLVTRNYRFLFYKFLLHSQEKSLTLSLPRQIENIVSFEKSFVEFQIAITRCRKVQNQQVRGSLESLFHALSF